MKKWWYRRILIMILILVSVLETGFSIEKSRVEAKKERVSTQAVANNSVIVGGMPIGIYMKTDGILVLGTDAIKGMNGKRQEPAKNLVKAGDYILALNGKQIESKKHLQKEIEQLDTNRVVLRLRRKGEEIEIKMNAVQTSKDSYKLGIWVRDSMQGLGTITYITPNGMFGALGHGIHDSDIEVLLDMKEGRIYKTSILRITKGMKGTPGGIEGAIIYNDKNYLGEIYKNSKLGIYGRIEDVSLPIPQAQLVEICPKEDMKKGKAILRCCIDGTVQDYEVRIEKVNRFSREKNKEIVVKVTDKELLDKTGGIVQGMSGSPIIQDGKLVGAVTHVLVNDPTRGYGIFIENMLDSAR